MSSPARGPRAVYDAIADAYDQALHEELEHKPLDRALLAAVLELAGSGPVADLGCGPGHVTAHLANSHPDVVGIDISPGMLAIARRRAPQLGFTVGSMLALPVRDGALAGAVALYSIIHFTAVERAAALRELARALRPGAPLLVSFHVESPDFAVGEVNRLRHWFGQDVELDGYFVDPNDVADDLRVAGFELTAALDRAPIEGAEYPSRRSYLLGVRR